MNALIVYYSFSHKVEYIANRIAEEIECDIEPIEPKNKLTNDAIVAISRKTDTYQEYIEIKKPKHNPNHYDLIFIGTPVWAWDFVPFIRVWKVHFEPENKNIAFFISHGGKMGDTLDNLYRLFDNNNIIGHIDFKDSRGMDYNCFNDDIIEWTKIILDSHKLSNI
ncbi:MAG: flavodoxin family protein [Candidatus Zixiibacteriota bacterium]